MATPYYGMIEEVWVMLIDDDKEFVTHMTVITVDTTSTTVSLLSKGNQIIDVMILNVHSSNLLSFALLAQAVALDIISLVVCDEFNELVAKKTLEDGAYLYLKKPFDKEIVRYLWQFVLSEKIQREKARKGSGKHKYHMKFVDISTNNIVGENKEPEEKNVSYTKEQSNNIHEAGSDVVLSGKYTLHRKRGCYPKKILEVMNLPGLTRMQVASHLQGATYSGSIIVSSTYIGNAIINNYNLNVLVDNVTTYSSSAMVSDTYVGNVTINGLGATNVNANAQQHVGEPIMSGPRNTDVASYENYVEGSNSNEKENCDAYLNFNNMDYLFQNLGPPSANLPNEQGNEFD
ncbi:two-component response regulator ARR2-like [Solanum verrucosum]|uniref:two-component response regulator ARR2-like n=1 Tax=Solanum verrucosum TaxID=315347 RepID=UPI0020D17FB5|nr:two-component response regulator ARR2-like [Solanum verrucosum]